MRCAFMGDDRKGPIMKFWEDLKGELQVIRNVTKSGEQVPENIKSKGAEILFCSADPEGEEKYQQRQQDSIFGGVGPVSSSGRE